MKMLFTLMATVLFSLIVEAQNVQPFYRDIKLPRQAVLEVQSVTPAAADTDVLKNDYAGPTSTAANTLTTFLTTIDVPRNIVITPGSTTADVAATTLTVNGTNIAGATISETFAFAANASSATTGAKAFKTITSIVFPANAEDSPFGATWDVGYGEKIGLRKCMADAGGWGWSSVGGVKETTVATIVADDNEVEKNTADFNGSMDGSAVFKAYYVQNYACYP